MSELLDLDAIRARSTAMPPQTTVWRRDIDRLVAEVERLRAELSCESDAELELFRADNARLRTSITAVREKALAPIRAMLEGRTDWDMKDDIAPGDLRRIIAEADHG